MNNMNEHEYEFLTGQWTGPKGAAYNQIYEFCKEFGWLLGFDTDMKPIPTRGGWKAINRYKKNLK